MRAAEGLEAGPTKHEAVLLVNVKGCGYPPSVNCTTWISQFGHEQSTFPCYYARTNQSVPRTTKPECAGGHQTRMCRVPPKQSLPRGP